MNFIKFVFIFSPGLFLASSIWTTRGYSEDQYSHDQFTQSPSEEEFGSAEVDLMFEEVVTQFDGIPIDIVESEILNLEILVQEKIDSMEESSVEIKKWNKIQDSIRGLKSDLLVHSKENWKQAIRSNKNFFKKAGGVVLRSFGYAGAGLDQIGSVPFRFFYKFFRGLFTGVAKREAAPLVIKNGTTKANGILLLGYGGESVLFSFFVEQSTVPSWLLTPLNLIPLIVVIDLMAKHVCTTEAPTSTNPRLQRFCRNLGKLYRTGYKISGYGDQAGAAVHRLFRKNKNKDIPHGQ